MIAFTTMGLAIELSQRYQNSFPSLTGRDAGIIFYKSPELVTEGRNAVIHKVLNGTQDPTEALSSYFKDSNFIFTGGDSSALLIRTQTEQARRGNAPVYTFPLPDAGFPFGGQLVKGNLVIVNRAPISEAVGIFSGSYIPSELHHDRASLWVPVPLDSESDISGNFSLVVGERMPNPSQALKYSQAELKGDTLGGAIYKFNLEGAPLLVRPGDAFMLGTSTPDTIGGAVVFEFDIMQYQRMVRLRNAKVPYCKEEEGLYRLQPENYLSEDYGTIQYIAFAQPALPRAVEV